MKFRVRIMIALLGGVLLLPTLGQSQQNLEVKKDIEKINQTYHNLKGLRSEIQYQLFQSYDATTPIETESGKFRQTKGSSYSSIGGMETLINDKYSLYVNHEDKIMLIQLPTEVGYGLETQLALDTFLNICTEIEKKDITKTTRSYTFHFDNYRYQKIKIVFNRQSYILSKATLFLRESEDLLGNGKPIQGRMEISYNNSEVNPSFSADSFSESLFIRNVNGKIAPAASFSSYHLTNYLPKK